MKESRFLPSGIDLAHLLADEAQFPSDDPRDRDDLAKVSSYYADMSGRRPLRERLRDVLNHDFPVAPLHRFLAAVPTPMVVVVTNYDGLVEKAFQAAGRPYDLVIYPSDRKDYANSMLWWPHGAAKPEFVYPKELHIDLSRTNIIYKMHGTIFPETGQWDSFVITEEDYVEFLSRMTDGTAIPPFLHQHFLDRSFLFLGYSLRDWNLRVVLRNLSKDLLRRAAQSDDDEQLPSWAVQDRPSELERVLWGTRKVRIFDLTLDEFVRAMEREAQGS